MTFPPLAETVASFDAPSAGYDRSRMHQVVAQKAVEAADPQAGQTLLDLAGGTPDAAVQLARASGLRAPQVELLRHEEPRTEDVDSTWARGTAGHPELPPVVQAAFRSALRDVVEHQLLLVVARPD